MIYQLKITLKGSKPPIWRRILVDPKINFHQLHRMIQIAMNWTDTHLHEFECKVPEDKEEEMDDLFNRSDEYSLWGALNMSVYDQKIARIGDPDEQDDIFGEDIVWDENEQILSEWFLDEKDKCLYTYDFGNDWRHEILLEKIVPREEGVYYPICMKARKEALSEDSQADIQTTDKEIADEINQVFLQMNEVLQPGAHAVQLELNGATLEEWRRLYLLAIQWKQLKSWKWMSGDDLFGVVDEESGHVGYCSVMGQGGEMYGLAVYPDNEGLTSLLKTIGEVEEDDYYDQRSLLLSLEDPNELDKKDRVLIEALDLPLKGHQWPEFKSFSPGLYPWQFNREEVLFFTRVLEQAIVVCQRAKEQPSLLKDNGENDIFARRWDCAKWDDISLPLTINRQVEPSPILGVNEIELLRIKKTHPIIPLTIEFDFMYSPDPIRENKGDRPFYPYLALWVANDDGFILDFVITPQGDHAIAIQEKTLNLINKLEGIPQEIWVKREEAYAILYTMARKLGIKLQFVPTLPMLSEAAEEMKSQFMLF